MFFAGTDLELLHDSGVDTLRLHQGCYQVVNGIGNIRPLTMLNTVEDFSQGISQPFAG